MPRLVEKFFSFESFITLFSLFFLVTKERIKGEMGLQSLRFDFWSKVLIFIQSFAGTMLMTQERRRAIWAIYGEGFPTVLE